MHRGEGSGEAGAGAGDAPHRPVVVELDPAVFIYLALGALVAWTTFALFRTAPDFMTAIAVGIVLALALDQPVSRLKARYGTPRPVAAVGVCSVLVAAGALLVVLLGPPAVQQASEFGQELPETVEDLYDLPVLGGRLEEADASARVSEWVEELPSNVSGEEVADTVDRLVGGLTATLAVVIVAFSVLLDGELIVSRLRRTVPERHRERADWVGRVFYRTLSQYFAGSLLLAVMMGIYVLTVGLALGVPLAPLAAVWAMITNLIPQVGGFLGGSVFVGLALTAGVVTGILALVLFVAYMSSENYLIQPAVVGRAVQLSPPATMIAALVGGVTAGVPGALVATPLVASVKAAYVELRFGRPVDEKPTSRLPFVSSVRRLVRRIRNS